MSTLLRMTAAAAAWALLAPLAVAQNPPASRPPAPKAPAARRPATPAPQPPQAQAQPVQRRTAYRPVAPVQYPAVPYGSPGYTNHPGYRSVLREPPPPPARYTASTYGVRNPGGIGRYAEYYPPGDVFQNGGHDPTPVAGFDRGLPVGSIEQQAMATQVGTQRYSVMQQHMDNFARPLGFYGFGWGAFGAPF